LIDTYVVTSTLLNRKADLLAAQLDRTEPSVVAVRRPLIPRESPRPPAGRV